MPSEYEVELFRRESFRRLQCPSCGRWFWSLREDGTCGEAPCQEYTFIGNPPIPKPHAVAEMREAFLSFLEANGHRRVKRYPLVARWRDDVFYTQASIYPFQPWVIDGLAEPPANPLAISQPCVRFNDVDNVGRTGQHFTAFEMMAHHVFNWPGKEVYWQDRTVDLCWDFLTKTLAVDPPKVAFVESMWEGGGNAGPCFEVTLEGSEVATLVFMMYKVDGPVRSVMPCQVVDTGYGLERLTWMSQGAPSAYEAVFGDVLAKLKQAAGVRTDERLLGAYSRAAGAMKIESQADVRELRRRVAERTGVSEEDLVAGVTPLEHLYALCDHSRALAWLLADGVVPSNVREGYFARLLVRRSLRMLRSTNLPVTLPEIVSMQVEAWKKDFTELEGAEERVLKLVRVEVGRYEETLTRGRSLVASYEQRMKKELRTLGPEELIELYDSHGLNPEIVQEFASGPVEVPDDFFARVAARHERPAAAVEAKAAAFPHVPPTKLLFYRYPNRHDFTANVLAFADGGVVLDRTYFYPEGGGQEADHGLLRLTSGRQSASVVEVQSVGGVVVHRLDGPLDVRVGRRIRGHVNSERRANLTRHHTATHILLGAARRVLGPHVWQTGAHKSEEGAHLDITHYDALTDEEVAAIERLANGAVLQRLKVRRGFVEREKAEARHGFSLYQGGSVPGRQLRVVEIEGWDAEACGGTHLPTTSEVGLIKVLRTKRIQDGVVRIEFVAGRAALEHVQQQSATLEAMARRLSVSVDKLPETVDRFFQEWKDLRKNVERLKGYEAAGKAGELLAAAEDVGGVKLVVSNETGAVADLVPLAQKLVTTPHVVAVLGARNGAAGILVARSEDVRLDCPAVVRLSCEVLGGSGGGKLDFAQGGGPRVDRLEEALRAAKDDVVRRVRAGP